jgi:hypothetical protein
MQRRNESNAAWRIALVTAASVALGMAGVARAEAPPPRPWDLSIDLYGWIPATDLKLSGDAFGGHFSNHFDKHLGDAFEDLDGGGGGDIRVRWNRFVGYFDGVWVQSDENSNGWFTNTIVDAKLGYRVLDLNPPTSSVPNPNDTGHHFALDLLAGGRYRNAETNVDIDTQFFGRQDFHDQREWFDPLIGLATEYWFTPHLYFSTVADIGGFDAGNGSHLTWSLNPRITYRAFDHLNIFLGWKYLREDHDSHFDDKFYGPQAGLGWAF